MDDLDRATFDYTNVFGYLIGSINNEPDKSMARWLHDYGEQWCQLLCEIGLDPRQSYSVDEIQRIKRAIDEVKS
jgi:hypothetical protein